MIENAILISSSLAIALGLVKIIERLLDGYLNKRNGKALRCGMLSGYGDAIMKIAEIQGRVDNDGIPLCYSPRSILESQEKIMASVQEVTRSQERIAETLERMQRVLVDERPRSRS